MAAALQLTDMMDEDAATELAIHYQLLSRYTHCLAIMVQAETEKAQTLPELHKVKQMLAAGWGGAGQICAYMQMDDLDCDPFMIRLDLRDDKLSLPEFAEYLNQYNTKSDPDLLLIIDHLPSAIRKALDNINVELSNSDISEDNILTVFLHLFLLSDYGKNLNRKISRIIKKRFKQAKLPKDLVKQISDKIKPILCQSPIINKPRDITEEDIKNTLLKIGYSR